MAERPSGPPPSVERGAGPGDEAVSCVLLIGGGPLADATGRALGAAGAAVMRLEQPSDLEIREALDAPVDHVVVISRFDHVSLRIALVVAHVRPGIPALVTIFDRDVAAHLQATVENVRVLSTADIVAPSFAGPCVDPGLISLVRTPSGVEGVRAVNGEPQRVPPTWPKDSPIRRLLANLEALVRPFDASAKILVFGLFGVFAVLIVETIVTVAAEGFSVVDALYSVAKVTVTAGPSQAAERGGAWFKLLSTAGMLLTLVFTAVFTAGLVNRLLDARLTGIIGRAAVPRRGHVIVVGLGQIGLRLCGLLREIGIPVVAVEQNPEAKNVQRAKEQRLPVVIGSGSSQRVLRLLSIDRARALAAVTSDEVENIAIAVAARGLAEELTIALRAGDGDATTETRSLFGIGVIRDIYQIAGTVLAAVTLGSRAQRAFPREGTLYLVDDKGRIEPFVSSAPQ